MGQLCLCLCLFIFIGWWIVRLESVLSSAKLSVHGVCVCV